MELYNLTKSFTRSLKDLYYYQYRGDIDDLASEFFTQFITPKARGDNAKETLLDKFDPNTTSLSYLVKVCVTRKLIDQSRQHPYKFVSIDALMDEKGDFITRVFDLVADNQASSILQDRRFLQRISLKFAKLKEEDRNKYYVSVLDTDSILKSYISPTFRFIRECPIQQVTGRSAVLYIPTYRDVTVFSIDDGHPKGNRRPFKLNKIELDTLRSYNPYHSQFSREQIIDYFT